LLDFKMDYDHGLSNGVTNDKCGEARNS
jgi:hypothetical protein